MVELIEFLLYEAFEVCEEGCVRKRDDVLKGMRRGWNVDCRTVVGVG